MCTFFWVEFAQCKQSFVGSYVPFDILTHIVNANHTWLLPVSHEHDSSERLNDKFVILQLKPCFKIVSKNRMVRIGFF